MMDFDINAYTGPLDTCPRCGTELSNAAYGCDVCEEAKADEAL